MQENNKHESDTIRQQRKAREEFLELKRMQNGEISPPPPPSADAIMPSTVKDKAENYWFYNKWLVIGALFLAVVLFICIKQCVSRVNYDLGVVVYTSNLIGDKNCEKIAEYFENVCDDVNGDGEVHVQVYNCSYSENGNSQTAVAINTKFQAIIVSEYEAMLFLTDENTLEHLNSIDSFKSLFVDTVKLPAKFYDLCNVDDFYALPDNLTISRRAISGTTMEKNDKAVACYDAAGRIINRIN